MKVRWRVLRMLWTASPWLLVAGVVFTLAEGLVPNLVLIAMGRVVGLIPGAAVHGLGSPDGHRMIGALTVSGALYALSLLRGPVEDLLSAMISARMSAYAQRRLVAAVSSPPGIGHLEDPEVLDRLASAQGELAGYEPSSAAMTLLGLLGDRLSGVLACGVLAAFHWWLGLAVLAMWLVLRQPLRALVAARTGTFRAATEPLRRSWYHIWLAWRPQAAKEIRVFGLGGWLAGRYREINAVAMEPSWREVRRLNRRIALLSLLVLAVYGVAAASLGWAAYHHTITLGVLVTMLTMLPASSLAGGLNASDFALESMLTAIPDLDSLTRDLAPTPAAGPETTTQEADTDAPAGLVAVRGLPVREVRFEGVSFRYPGGDHDVLDGLDLTLPAGRSTALVGVNGAGKTTLITLLARLREPTGGRITVDGIALEELPAREWQRQVAAVFQDYARFPLTARENVAMLGETDPEVLEEVARRAGAHALVKELPRGWDTVLSEKYPGGQDLSGGQWQRIVLARALYAVRGGARVLVMDEPTAQLDVRAEARFYDRFLEITQGVTSLVISHRFSTVRKADRIAVLDGGRITELGSHEELLDIGGTYAEMFRLQAARFA